MYKKIIFSVLLVLILYPISTFAEWQCKLTDSPDPELLKYIENIRKITSNISQEITQTSQIKAKQDFWKMWALITKTYNNSISWGWYYSSWDYYVYKPLTTNWVPYEIKRDNDLIEKESESLSKFLERIISNWYSDNIIKDACKWVDSNTCNLSNMKASDIIWELIKNTIKLWDTYKANIFWANTNPVISFWWPRFPQIWNSYNTQMVTNCSRNEEWFLKKITDAMGKILIWNKNWKDWMAAWQEWIDLMLWRSPNYEKTEKELLSRELSRQWVNSSNKAILMGNLARYNAGGNWDWWFSEKNNFISNSFDMKNSNLSKQFSDIKKDLFDPLNKKDPTWNQAQIKKSVKEIIALWKKNDITTSIVTRISEVYQDEAMYSRIEDNNTQKVQWKLFSMHIKLLSAINKLNKTIPLAEATCKSQDKWNWRCTTK